MEIKKSNRRDYDKAPRQRRDYDGDGNSRAAKPRGHREEGERPSKPWGHREEGERPSKPWGHREEGARTAKSRFTPGGERRTFGRYDKKDEKPRVRHYGQYDEDASQERPKMSPKPWSRHEEGDRPAKHYSKPAGFPSHRPVSKPARQAQAPTNEMRLNKFIANSGICSRREADNLIQSGAVSVNGKPVTELGTKIDVRKDVVLFGDQRLRGEEKVYIVMNKPKGFVTTTSDPHADQTVMDLLTKCPARVFPVGRLDKNTTGVLMFTNDGEMSEKLTHPSFNKKKIYEVTLDRKLTSEDAGKILSGLELEDGRINADQLEYTDAADQRKVGIEIHSGRNRIVRRMFESLGYTVKALDRVYFAGLTKKGIKRGQWRYLTEGEVNILKMGAFS